MMLAEPVQADKCINRSQDRLSGGLSEEIHES